ncbi:MAG TPA: tetratricopeptide repeat protein [Pyrinomonadaceae bacterium]|nr:tetratricopeptide repeat protein [Pyrinomonadaceae bacterium]
MKNKNRNRFKNFRLIAVVSFLFVFGANCSRNSSPDKNQLTPGNPVTKKIMNEEIHAYSAELEKGQFVNLSVEQRDVDVITKVFTPTGELVGEFATPTSGRGTEAIRIGTETAGEYRIEIYTLSERAEPGEYKLEIAAFHPLAERDRKVISAVKLHQQADVLRSKPETRRESILVYEKALQLWRKLGELADEGNTLRAMGFAYQRMDELEKAKEHFGKALDIWNRIGDSRSAAFTRIIFGVIHKKQNDYENGLKEDLKAQPLWEKAGDMPEYTQNLVRIGNDYIKLQNNTEALKYFEQALENSRRLERKSTQAYVLSECGNAQATVGNKNEALNFYRQSLELWKNLKQDKVVTSLEEKIAKLEVN